MNSFLNGFTSLNLSPEISFSPIIETKKSSEINLEALKSDWEKIGKDSEKSIKKYEKSSVL